MKTLNLNEQEMVAGGHFIGPTFPYRPNPGRPYPPWSPYRPVAVDIEAIKRDIAQSVSLVGIGIAAPQTAAPWSAGNC
jgi:hypothetical protein